jgi:GMP synthase (glutamine-hydrolysing)
VRSERRVVRVLQHVAPEGPGRIAAALERNGLAVARTRIDLGEPVLPELAGALGLVVMGGPMGVYETERYAHLADEQRLIQRALDAGVPVLGVCLGAQLLASTLGARVYPGPTKEIGWLPVTRTEASATDPLFTDLPASFIALHWHGDIFDLPQAAVSLARSALTDHQAFRWGEHAYGLLFHLEATEEQTAAMARLFADELAGARVDAGELLAKTPAGVRDTEAAAASVFGAWTRAVTTRAR